MTSTPLKNAVRDNLVPDVLRRIALLPEIREARVRELRFLINAGLYTIDPLKIADRMLHDR